MLRIHPSLLFGLLAACPSLCAQGALYSPTYMASVEGEFASSVPGNYAAMRYQTCDGENRGVAASIREIAFRLDYRSYNRVFGTGRRFKNLRIRLADGDVSKFTANFATNSRSTPTTVFSASVTWPTVGGYPLTKPARWGGITGAYRFPFKTNWLYAGKQDILSDWTFAGGTLQNRARWGSATAHLYPFDSFGSPNSYTNGTYKVIPETRLRNNAPGVKGRCNDSAFGKTPIGAYSYIYALAYGPNHANPAWRNSLVMRSESYYTAFNAPVIHAWGFITNVQGIDLDTGCNRLHTMEPYVLTTHITKPKSVNTSGYSGYKLQIFPWHPLFGSVRVCMQAAWADSKSRRLNLSQAQEVVLPQELPPPGIHKRVSVNSHATSGPSKPSFAFSTNPAMRYLY